MHRVMVIVFDNETKSEEGKNELLRLDSEGSISIYGFEVLVKKPDGTVLMTQADGHGTLSPFAKTLLGSLRDSNGSIPKQRATITHHPQGASKTETGEEFIYDVMEILVPNRVAIVAEIEEEWPAIVDRCMAPIASAIFRWTVSETEHAIEM